MMADMNAGNCLEKVEEQQCSTGSSKSTERLGLVPEFIIGVGCWGTEGWCSRTRTSSELHTANTHHIQSPTNGFTDWHFNANLTDNYVILLKGQQCFPIFLITNVVQL